MCVCVCQRVCVRERERERERKRDSERESAIVYVCVRACASSCKHVFMFICAIKGHNHKKKSYIKIIKTKKYERVLLVLLSPSHSTYSSYWTLLIYTVVMHACAQMLW